MIVFLCELNLNLGVVVYVVFILEIVIEEILMMFCFLVNLI